MEGKTQGRRRERLGRSQRGREGESAPERGGDKRSRSPPPATGPPWAGVSRGWRKPACPCGGNPDVGGCCQRPQAGCLGLLGSPGTPARKRGSQDGCVCCLGDSEDQEEAGGRQRAVGSFRQTPKKRTVSLTPASDPGKCGSSEPWCTGGDLVQEEAAGWAAWLLTGATRGLSP